MEHSAHNSRGLYNALPSTRHIRLLEIFGENGLAETKMHLKMIVADLEVQPLHYYALSYTWGSPIATPECDVQYSSAHNAPITIDVKGHSISASIGRNLYEALWQIHQQNFHAPLWVDALCIKQADIVGKSLQVQLMAKIYGKASLVIAWLGTDDPDLPGLSQITWIHTELPGALREPREESGFLQKGRLRQLKSTDVGDGMELIRSDERRIAPSPDKLKALYRFYRRRRYFTRVWIMQELTLAPRVTVLFENQSLSLDLLVEVAVQLTSKIEFTPLYQESIDFTQADGSELVWFGMLRRTKDGLANISQDFLDKQDPDERFKDAVQAIGFILCAGNIRGCSDRRDVLYSYIGMLSAMRLQKYVSLQVDYSISTAELYTNFIKQMLLMGPSNDALCLGSEDPNRHGNDLGHALPTWVPDFSLNREGSIISHQIVTPTGSFPNFNACKQTYKLPIRLEGSLLHLHGRRCSGIQDTIPPTPIAQEVDTTGITLLRNAVARAVVVLEFCISLGQTYPTGSSTISAFLRTFRFEISSTATEAYSILVRRFHAWCTVLVAAEDEAELHKNDPETLASPVRFNAAIRKLSSNSEIPSQDDIAWFQKIKSDDYVASPEELEEFTRIAVDSQQLDDGYMLGHLFATSDGFMGRCVNALPEKDEVWLIRDASVPFILRPVDGGRHQLVNEAFIHGAMYGELVDKGVPGEVEQITIV